MDSLNKLYNQYYQLIENLQSNESEGLSTNLLQDGIECDGAKDEDTSAGFAVKTKEYSIDRNYYAQVDKATGLLVNFYDKYLRKEDVRLQVNAILKDRREENVKFCFLVDVLRCYDGLDHPTTFNNPEGIALMILLGRIFHIGEINDYMELKMVSPLTLSLIDLLPYIDALSCELGNRYSLFLSSILSKISSDTDNLYRLLLYNFCKRIAEVDGKISISEQDWLNEIALLNDDDPNNDIDLSKLQ